MSDGSVKRYGRPRKMICDGTLADYRRHYRHGERPCAESRAVWREYYKGYAAKQQAKRKRAAARRAAAEEYNRAMIPTPEGKEGSALYRLGVLKHLKDPIPPSTPEEIERANLQVQRSQEVQEVSEKLGARLRAEFGDGPA